MENNLNKSNFLYRTFFLLFVFLFLTFYTCLGQCGCSSSQQFFPPLHWLGTSEIAISEKKRLRLDFMYKFGAGENLFKGSDKISSETNYKIHFFDLFASYGVSNYTAIDFYINYNLRLLSQYNFTTKGYGFSIAALGLRHTFYESDKSDLILNAGAGIKIPLMGFKPIEEHPILVQPTTGAFGINAFAFLQKSLPDYFFNILIYSRFDYNFKNNQKYQFGPSITSSLFLSRRFSERFTSLVEIRYSKLLSDKNHDTIYPNSGANLLLIVPRLTLFFEGISISPFAEFPLYQNYNGEQIGFRFALGLNINIVYNFSRRKL